MTRASMALNEKHRAVMAVGVGVSPQAQRLFNTISKTIDEIKWGGKDGKEISIMSQVRGLRWTVLSPGSRVQTNIIWFLNNQYV